MRRLALALCGAVCACGGATESARPAASAANDDAEPGFADYAATHGIQTLEGDSAPLKTRYYVIGPQQGANARAFQGVDAAPDWASTYWAWKSARAAPGHPELVIQVETHNKSGGIPTQSLRDKAANRGIDNAIAALNPSCRARRSAGLRSLSTRLRTRNWTAGWGSWIWRAASATSTR